MYKCLDCGYVFEEPKICYEDLSPGCSFEGGAFNNRYYGCPRCEDIDYKEMIECSRCGNLTIKGHSYNGQLLWEDCLIEIGLKNGQMASD